LKSGGLPKLLKKSNAGILKPHLGAFIKDEKRKKKRFDDEFPKFINMDEKGNGISQ
jgi:hypothetical protein